MTHPIVERISARMKTMKMTKKALSDASGIDYNRLFTWFREDRPNAKPNGEDIAKVAFALDVPVRHLTDGEPISSKSDTEEIISVYDFLGDKRKAEMLSFARYLREREARENDEK